MNTEILRQAASLNSLEESEHTTRSWDGTELFYRAWLPPVRCERAIILIHRGHEHSGRWRGMVTELALPGTAFFAWDARGHGQSPGERGAAEHFGVYVKDLDAFVKFISNNYGIAIENMVVLGHSVGAVV